MVDISIISVCKKTYFDLFLDLLSCVLADGACEILTGMCSEDIWKGECGSCRGRGRFDIVTTHSHLYMISY